MALGNAAAAAASVTGPGRNTSGWLGRDRKAKYMRFSQGPDRCFLYSSVQCLKHLSPGPLGGEVSFSWLIEEFWLLQDSVK